MFELTMPNLYPYIIADTDVKAFYWVNLNASKGSFYFYRFEANSNLSN